MSDQYQPPVHDELLLNANVPIPEAGEDNWTSTRLGRLIAAGALACEVTPLNEAIRLAAFGGALKYGGDPASAAMVAGAVTMAVESSAAIVTADMLDTDGAKKATEKVNAKLETIGLDGVLKTNVVTETGVAMFGGSAVLLALKHRQDTRRTRQQNRRYGLVSAAGISLMTTGQALAVGEGIHHPSPMVLGLAAVAIGGAIAGGKAAVNRLKRTAETAPVAIDTEVTRSNNTVVEVAKDVGLTPSLLERSLEAYEEKPRQNPSAQTLGLSKEDVRMALEDADTYKIRCATEAGEEIVAPFLVPVKNLYWFNEKSLQENLGTKDIYYYAHPNADIDSPEIETAIDEVLSDGAVILYDVVNGTNGDMLAELGDRADNYEIKQLGTEKQSNFLEQYVGLVEVNGSKELKPGKEDMYTYYRKAVEQGLIPMDPRNGTIMLDVVDDREAAKLWDIYRAPFEKLAENHPMGAGFDKEGFFDLLKDPRVTKVLNRDNGEPTTLATFIKDFKHSPWLHEDYFRKNYAEAYDTDNLLIFTGIVADQSRKTPFRSLALIKLLMDVGSVRDSAMAITFECSEVSAKYTPKIVEFAINRSGKGKLGPLEAVSKLEYFAVTSKES
jgi:hypothetical protein